MNLRKLPLAVASLAAVGMAASPAPAAIAGRAAHTDALDRATAIAGAEDLGGILRAAYGIDTPRAPRVAAGTTAALRNLEAALSRAEAMRAAAAPAMPRLDGRVLVAENGSLPSWAGTDVTSLLPAAVAVADALDDARASFVPVEAACDGAVPVPPTVLPGDVAVDLDGVATRYDRAYRIVVDLGGCDVYAAGGGAASGTAGQPVGAILDFGGGDDLYRNGPDTFAFGGAIAGTGVFLDDGGDDLYETTGYGTFGAGVVGGVGIFADLGGDDRFLFDGAGGGYGSHGLGTLGVGVSIDLGGGDDVYDFQFDPGETPGGFTRLLSAFGVSTGGLGLLVDDGGHDVYDAFVRGDAASVNGQGVASFGGTGALFDLGGDDVYAVASAVSGGDEGVSTSAVGQAVGQIDGSGILVDLAGNDRFTISATAESNVWGAAIANGQGSTLGLLQYTGDATFLDVAGDDVHRMEASVAAPDGATLTEGQGSALYDSAAAFADLSGVDGHAMHAQGPGADIVGQGAGRGTGTGSFLDAGLEADLYTAASDRVQGYGGTFDFGDGFFVPGGQGLFLDAGGSNVYAGREPRRAFWTNGNEGVGIGADAGAAVREIDGLVDYVFWLFGMERP